jgi:hypothetical protein
MRVRIHFRFKNIFLTSSCVKTVGGCTFFLNGLVSFHPEQAYLKLHGKGKPAHLKPGVEWMARNFSISNGKKINCKIGLLQSENFY